jgi:hypothetical protein
MMSLDFELYRVSMFIDNRLTFNLNLKIEKEWEEKKRNVHK